MSRASLRRAIPRGASMLLDSSALIAYLVGNEPASPASEVAIDELVRAGHNEAVISMISVLEVLVRPLQRSANAYAQALDFITHFPNFRHQPIDLRVAQEAAGLRATARLPTPDAIVIATGVVAGATILVGNDRRWKQLADRRLRVVHLADHVPV